MKNNFCLILICFLFISCGTTGGLKIPGQGNKEIKNIYVEYINIADNYFNLEKYDKALTYYEKALNYKETYWAVYYKMAKCYAYKKDWNKSEEYFNVLYQRDSDNSSLKASLAYILAMKNELEKSEQLYEELVSEQPAVQEYLANYIAILIQEEKKSEAVEKLSLLKEQFPNNTNISKFEALLKEPETD